MLIAEARTPELPPGPPVTAVQKLPGSISPSAAPPAAGRRARSGIERGRRRQRLRTRQGERTARRSRPPGRRIWRRRQRRKTAAADSRLRGSSGSASRASSSTPATAGTTPAHRPAVSIEAELVLDIALRAGKAAAEDRRASRSSSPAGPTSSSRCRNGRRWRTARAPICSCRFTPTPSSSTQAHGIETYFLNFANNLSAAAVAARENAASGQAMSALPDIVKAIALNNKLDESRDFATQVQHAMVEHLRNRRTRRSRTSA